jgi:hypothetical protein
MIEPVALTGAVQNRLREKAVAKHPRVGMQ